MDSICEGDSTGLTRCSLCNNACLKVNSQLLSLAPNSTNCFYFTILYAARIANKFGPKDVHTAMCILGLQLVEITTPSNNSRLNRLRIFVFSFLGAFVVIFVIFELIIVYKIQARRKHYDQEDYVSTFKARGDAQHRCSMVQRIRAC